MRPASRRAPEEGRAANGRSRSTDRPLGHDPDERDGFGEALQRERAAILVPDALDPPREVRDLARREDLAGARLPHSRAARFSAPPR